MMKSLYTLSKPTAIILAVLLLASCSGKQKQDTIHIDSQRIALAEQVAMQSRMQPFIQQARLEYPRTTALNKLLDFSQDSQLSDASRGQAALAYAEVLLALNHPNALAIAVETLKLWDNHPLSSALHLALAKALIATGDIDKALSHLTFALPQASTEQTRFAAVLQAALPIVEGAADDIATTWLLQRSLYDTEKRNSWLKQAAKRASITYVLQLRQSATPLSIEQANFYQFVARQALMVGDYHTVRVVAKILQLDMPDSEANRIVQAWAMNEGDQNIVGVLLPLSGQYAAYGQQMLKGIRLAMSRPEFADNISLRIEDTQGNTHLTIAGYHRLLTQNVQWVIGPLLSNNTAALLPYLVDDIPLVSLSNQIQLAVDAPSLFIHNLSKSVQASFMAAYAWKKGKKRIAIIHGHRNSEKDEAAAFIRSFEAAGGAVVGSLALQSNTQDHRTALVSLLEQSADELQLASLDEDLHLFSAESNMDIKTPPNFDSLYIAVSGKQLSVLAGQMAYLDMRKVQLYGSYRWFDGHLMDDGGRYLSYAEFTTPLTALLQPNQAVLDIQSQARVIWAKETTTPLFSLAYDVAMNVASVGSKLGLTGKKAMKALRDPIGFPAISGDYYFNADGISQKTFAIQRVRRGRIEPVPLE